MGLSLVLARLLEASEETLQRNYGLALILASPPAFSNVSLSERGFAQVNLETTQIATPWAYLQVHSRFLHRRRGHAGSCCWHSPFWREQSEIDFASVPSFLRCRASQPEAWQTLSAAWRPLAPTDTAQPKSSCWARAACVSQNGLIDALMPDRAKLQLMRPTCKRPSRIRLAFFWQQKLYCSC